MEEGREGGREGDGVDRRVRWRGLLEVEVRNNDKSPPLVEQDGCGACTLTADGKRESPPLPHPQLIFPFHPMGFCCDLFLFFVHACVFFACWKFNQAIFLREVEGPS